MMDRRTFLAGTGAVLLVTPLVAEAQQAAGKVYRLGILSPGGAPDPSIPTIPNLLPAALRAFGYVRRPKSRSRSPIRRGQLRSAPRPGT
jgi:hypothetical protein